MRWSATRARWVLLGGAVLLMAVLAAFFGLARYRAGKVWQRILARNGVHVTRESNGITWSQSSKGRTIFTVHAAKAVPQGPNKWLLHDAVLILYGRQPGHDDRIYGSEFQYDETEGVARALGEVHLDLQLPEAGGKAPAAGAQPALEFGTEPTDDPGMIHVRTSGLVYMRKLGLAATGEPAEFRFRGLTCTSRGAEFDTDHSVVRLLADVRLSGELRQAPFSLAASRATLDRNANSADLETPFLVSGDRSARAQHTVLHLRKDGSLEGAEADGAVQMRTGTQTLEAPLLKANFGPQSVPEQAQLSTGVAFTDRSATAPAQGSAKTLDLLWTAGGTLQQATANGSVSFLERAVRNGAETGTRQMRAEQAVALFVPASAKRVELSKLHLVGGAEIRSVGASDPAGGDGTPSLLRVAGDALTAAFAGGVTGRPLVQTLTGEGHTHLEQTAADGARQTSTGDKLEMSFAPAPLNGPRGAGMAVSSAVQTGHVEIVSFPAASPAKAGASTSAPTTARADRALYAASAGTVTLTGEQGRKPNLRSAGTEVEANTLVLHQGTGDAEMEEGVVATDPGEGDAPATHILARRANLLHDAGLAEFLGMSPGRHSCSRAARRCRRQRSPWTTHTGV